MKNKLTKEDIQKRINILKVGIMSSNISQKTSWAIKKAFRRINICR